MRDETVVEIVRIVQGVRGRESGLQLSPLVDHPIENLLGDAHRVIADVPELDLLGAENVGSLFGFGAARGFDLVEGHAVLAPELGAFAAFTEGKADDFDVVALLGMERDRTARAPYEVGGVGGNDQGGFLVGHG